MISGVLSRSNLVSSEKITNSGSSGGDGFEGGRFLAMLMVVYGHWLQYAGRYSLPGLTPGEIAKILHYLYSVHIQVFFFIAGFVYYKYSKPIGGFGKYRSFLAGKALRLLVPFLSVSLVQFAVKYFLGGGEPRQLAVMLFAPRGGPAAHLWFLYVLFAIFAIAGSAELLRGAKKPIALFACSLALACLPIGFPSYKEFGLLDLQSLVWFMQFFLAGSVLAEKGLNFPALNRYWFFALLAFGVWGLSRPESFSGYPSAEQGVFNRIFQFAVTLAGIAAVIRFGSFVKGVLSRFVAGISGLSYDIYLLHVIIAHGMFTVFVRLKPGLAASLVWVTLGPALCIGTAILIAGALRAYAPLRMVFLGLPYRR